MRSFYVTREQIKDESVVITGQDAKHLAKVLRMAPGDKVKVFDGSGNSYLVTLTSVRPNETVGEITAINQELVAEPPIRVNLVQGLPKQGKMELIVQKCTELGVGAIYPVETGRTVVKLGGTKGAERSERWQKVAVEAVKQCGRSAVPQIYQPLRLELLLAKLPQDKALVLLWEGERSQSLKSLLTNWQELDQIPAEIFVVVGPEGGFGQEEVDMLMEHGAQVVTLGPRILRTETAGMAALTMILYQLGDLGG